MEPKLWIKHFDKTECKFYLTNQLAKFLHSGSSFGNINSASINHGVLAPSNKIHFKLKVPVMDKQKFEDAQISAKRTDLKRHFRQNKIKQTHRNHTCFVQALFLPFYSSSYDARFISNYPVSKVLLNNYKYVMICYFG